MPPSSMTKLMTAYIVYGAAEGRPAEARPGAAGQRAGLAHGQGSKMFVQLGRSVKVEDLIRGMIVQSGNDACIVLAEGIAGSEEQFVELMNAQGQGARPDQHATSATAPAGRTRTHRMSCPRHRHAGAAAHPGLPGILPLRFGKDVQVQQHRAGKPQPAGAEGHLADGLKTGHTEAGGYGLVRQQPAQRAAGDRWC